jgi:hypothetical protein
MILMHMAFIWYVEDNPVKLEYIAHIHEDIKL